MAHCRWVQKVMQNGFRTPQGSLTVLGLMGLPVWLWARRYSHINSLPKIAGRSCITQIAATTVQCTGLMSEAEGASRTSSQFTYRQSVTWTFRTLQVSCIAAAATHTCRAGQKRPLFCQVGRSPQGPSCFVLSCSVGVLRTVGRVSRETSSGWSLQSPAARDGSRR